MEEARDVSFRVEHGDSLKLIRRLPGSSIGAVISDPPFFIGIGRPANWVGNAGLGEDPWVGADVSSVASAIAWTEPFAEEFYRVLRPGGACALMAGAHASAAWMVSLEAAGLLWMAEIAVLWNTGKPRRSNFGSLSMHILWFTRPGARHTWNSTAKSIYSNVIVARKVPADVRDHPAQKPVALTNFLVSLLTKPEDVVLDPFCGSGGTLVSAVLCGRDCIGMDADESWCKAARRRVIHSEIADEGDLWLWVNGRLVPV